MVNWFKKAVMEKPPYKLNWHKDVPQFARLAMAIQSRPKNWSPQKKILSSARALNALANVTKDSATRIKARGDAKLLFADYNTHKKWG